MYQINIISISILFLFILIILILGFVEIRLHLNSLKKIPIRIHVNGIRGKSSVVRLIAAGLRESGLKTFAKTTGTIPRIINEKGNDVELHRLRTASIGEQIKLMRYFAKQTPDALVIECMAVNPQYQWISEHRIVRSTLGVITNVRRDHLDEMGTTILDIAKSISNTIPFNSKIVSSQNKFVDLFKSIAAKRNSDIDVSDTSEIKKDYIDRFPYIEHPENIALALKVCNNLGIDNKIALRGMLKTNPDPGVLFIWDILKNKNKNQFISAFAANDPDSTIKVWNLIKNKSKNKKSIFLNTRNDRRYRTVQLIDLVYNVIKPDLFIIRGDNLNSIIKKYNNKDIKLKLFDMTSSQNEVVNYITSLNGFFIMGIGNIVGWGDDFLKHLKEFQVNG